MDISIIIGLVVGVVFGGAIVWTIASNRVRKEYSQKIEELQSKVNVAEGKVSALDATLNTEREQSEKVREEAAKDFKGLREKLSLEEQARVKAETEKNETVSKLKEEKELLNTAREKLSETFKVLAGETLSTNSKQFLREAKAALETLVTDAKGDLGKRQAAIDGLVKPLSDSLKLFDEHVRSLETKRQAAYTSLEEHLKSLTVTQQLLQHETANLVTALRTPQVRGRWGEMTLRRVVELAGMSEHCDFTEQKTVETEDGRLRPDLIVRLPSNRDIVVDAKVPLISYLSATTAESEEEREELLNLHAAQLRTHMDNLAAKAYWEQFKQAPEFVVMFIPGESFFAEAAHHDLSLIEDGMQKRVIPATPTTLIALLRAVAYGWRQEQIAKNAQIISELGKQVHDRMRNLAEHIVGVGLGLKKATLSYNDAIGSLEQRVLPAARRFRDLGVTSGEEIPILEPVETTLRSLNAPEVSENDPEQS